MHDWIVAKWHMFVTLVTGLWHRLTDHFVEDWNKSLKWGSVRLHIIATTLIVPAIDFLKNNPTALRDLAAQLPPNFPFLPTLIVGGGIWLVAGWLVRVWHGRKP